MQTSSKMHTYVTLPIVIDLIGTVGGDGESQVQRQRQNVCHLLGAAINQLHVLYTSAMSSEEKHLHTDGFVGLKEPKEDKGMIVHKASQTQQQRHSDSVALLLVNTRLLGWLLFILQIRIDQRMRQVTYVERVFHEAHHQRVESVHAVVWKITDAEGLDVIGQALDLAWMDVVNQLVQLCLVILTSEQKLSRKAYIKVVEVVWALGKQLSQVDQRHLLQRRADLVLMVRINQWLKSLHTSTRSALLRYLSGSASSTLQCGFSSEKAV